MAGYFRYIIFDIENDKLVAGPFSTESQAVAHLRKIKRSYKKDTLFISEIPS